MKVRRGEWWCTVENASEKEIEAIASTLTFVEEEIGGKPSDLDIKAETQENWADKLDYFVFLQKTEQSFKFLTGLLPYFKENYPYEFEVTSTPQEKELERVSIPADYLEDITLRKYQVSAVEKALTFRKGILEIPTRGGKTEVMISIAKYALKNFHPDQKILFVEPDSGLMHQTYERCLVRGMESVGRLGDGNRELDRDIIVSTVDSFYNILKDPNHQDRWVISEVKSVLVDEVHHLGSPSMAQIPLSMTDLSVFIGVSGTPFNDQADPHSNPRDVAIIGLLHRIIFKVSSNYLMDKGFIAEPHVFVMGYNGPYPKFFIKNYNKVYNKFIVWNTGRNSMIKDTAEVFLKHDFNCLILVTRIDHGKHLMKWLQSLSDDILFAYGGGKVIRNYDQENIPEDLPDGWNWYGSESDRKKGLKYFQYPGEQQEIIDNHFNQDTGKLLIGSQIFDEGVDLPTVDAVIIAGAQGKSDVKNTQRPARALTANDHDNRVYLIDFWDDRHRYLKKHSELRIKAYQRNGYFVHTGGIEELTRYVDESSKIRKEVDE